jgi:general secretion pathway protein G
VKSSGRIGPSSGAQGFTFIELAITVAIVALLATAVLPLAELTVKRTKEQELRSALRQIRTALDEYKKAVDEGKVPKKVDETGYPPKLEILVDGVVDAKDPNLRKRIYFLRRLPRDPFNDNSAATPAETWGKRSYESAPDQPQPGSDVYDVYSLSEGVGINGIPYRQW